MIKLVTNEDYSRVMEIINDAKAYMALTGSKQWQGGYPNEEVIQKDIDKGQMYGYYIDNKVCAIIVLVQELTLNYIDIDGKWDVEPSDDDLIIHRIAVKKEYRGQGLGKKMMEFAVEYAKKNHILHLKTDTHPLNISMQKTAESVGFVKKGIVQSRLEKVDKYRFVYELNLE